MARVDRNGRLDAQLLSVYNQHGVEDFLSVCSELISSSGNAAKQHRPQLNGEVCELVLRVLTHEYKRAFAPNTMNGYHSVILGGEDKTSDFRTEIDFVTMMPGVMLLGECKSYSGMTDITGQATIENKGNSYNVYKQLQLHYSAMRPLAERHLRPGMLLTSAPVSSFIFVYCNGIIKDKRSAEYKKRVPIITVSNLFKYYDTAMANYNKVSYNLKTLSKELYWRANSEQLQKEHQQYLGYR